MHLSFPLTYKTAVKKRKKVKRFFDFLRYMYPGLMSHLKLSRLHFQHGPLRDGLYLFQEDFVDRYLEMLWKEFNLY